MAHGIISTLSIAAIGLVASRISELFRKPLVHRDPCDAGGSSAPVWSYKPESAQQGSTWVKVGRHGTC